MRSLLFSLVSLCLVACTDDGKVDDSSSPPDDTSAPIDEDGDGYDADEDCDDGDPAVNPGATEACNSLDDDCDGDVDEDAGTAWYTDADGDGFGDDAGEVFSCEQPAGAVEVGGDCDDRDPAYNPAASEDDCSDPNDYNCDGSVGYADGDGDGHPACQDCDDDDAGRYPGADEICNELDDDCDGEVDEGASGGGTFYRDLDEDGYGDPADTTSGCTAPEGYAALGDDCNDTSASVNPGAAELCDGIDNDCDAEVDEAGAADEPTWYMDADADGYGDPASPLSSCEAPDGYSAYDTDCDDTDAAYNPAADEACEDTEDYNCDGSTGYDDADGDGWAACEECDDGDSAVNPDAVELCNGVDDDCDATVDEDDAADATNWYADSDGDTYGDALSAVSACEPPEGFVGDGSDCDDGDDGVNPGATEVCDGVDGDCDGDVDEDAADATEWYTDADGDGFGDEGAVVLSCDAIDGLTDVGGDCDDAADSVNPDATEVCNDIDDDCNGYADDGATDLVTYYADADADGYGDPSDSVEACGAPDGYVADASDCDDTDASVLDGLTWYADGDGDGYGDAGDALVACDAPAGYVADDADCDDGDSDTNPGADEVCDGLDNDCDGSEDEGAADLFTWYADADADGYGDPSSTTEACDMPAGYVDDDTDCDDGDADVNPLADELCDDVDNDCDGDVDEDGVDPSTWYADADADGYGDASDTALSCGAPAGYVDNSADCDDGDSDISPDADETCDAVDNDCDGSVDEAGATGGDTWYRDTDRDGFGDPSATTDACDLPSGYADNSDDCDDDEASVYPGADEICADGFVNDCDGTEAAATAACALEGGSILADSALAVLSGTSADSGAGFSVAPGGDLNGDGDDDLLIGAYHDGVTSSKGGAAYIVFGPVPGDLSLSDADVTFTPTSSGDELGQALAAAGDMDGDGNPDLLLTAPKDDPSGTDSGSTYVVMGPFTGDLSMSDADATITGELAGDVAGRAVQPLGDWDGDGELDVAVGAAGADPAGLWSGMAYVMLGPISGEVSVTDAALSLAGEAVNDFAGRWLAGDADLDGDGTPDLVVGAYGDDEAGSTAGAAYVVYGPATGALSLSDADVKLLGEAANDQAGRAAAVLPDSDGDGLPELAVGAWGNDAAGGSAGAAYLMSSLPSGVASLATADTIITGARKTDNLGISVAAAGDVDGDGAGDLLLGAQGEYTYAADAGAAYLAYGPFASGTYSASTLDVALKGDASTGAAGWCVSSAGDTNHDGLDEILVGAYEDDTVATDAGVVYLLGGAY